METNSTELRRRQNDARKNIPHRHSRRCPEQFREHLFRIQRDIERAMVEESTFTQSSTRDRFGELSPRLESSRGGADVAGSSKSATRPPMW